MTDKADSATKAEPNTSGQFVLAGLISGLLGQLAPDADLAPAEGESAIELGERLASQAATSIETLQAELAATKRQLSAQKGQVTKARNEVAALEAQMPDKPRKIEGPKEAFPAAELMDLIQDADEIQLLFSDGKAELAGVAPKKIEAAAWRKHSDRVLLMLPSLTISSVADRPQQLVAYALMIDGDIVAVRPRFDPLTVKPNQRMELAGDVIF